MHIGKLPGNIKQVVLDRLPGSWKDILKFAEEKDCLVDNVLFITWPATNRHMEIHRDGLPYYFNKLMMATYTDCVVRVTIGNRKWERCIFEGKISQDQIKNSYPFPLRFPLEVSSTQIVAGQFIRHKKPMQLNLKLHKIVRIEPVQTVLQTS